MARSTTPTLRRRELGTRLRVLRQQSGLTLDEVATRLMISAGQVSRIETGARGARLRDVRDLCEIYGVSAEEREHLMFLARESKETSWWQRYGLDPAYSTFVGLEAAAASEIDYESSVLPGLLQSEPYSQALIEGNDPTLDDHAIQQQVETRIRRQLLLTGDRELALHAICDEAALHRIVGGPAVMRAALEAVVERSTLPNVTVQVIPFEAGAHPGLNSTFTILHFEEEVPDVVYVQGLFGQHYLENPGDLERYRRTFERLTSAALTPAQSRARISGLVGEYTI